MVFFMSNGLGEYNQLPPCLSLDSGKALVMDSRMSGDGLSLMRSAGLEH